MKKPKKVQAPDGCSENFTPGKIYDVIGFWVDGIGKNGHRFTIIADCGIEADCLEKNCAHLKGKDWIIVEAEPITYPHPPDPNIDYGEPNHLDSTCAECGQVWLKEDFNGGCTCPACRPVSDDELEEANQADEEFWGKMTRGCERYHREREERE